MTPMPFGPLPHYWLHHPLSHNCLNELLLLHMWKVSEVNQQTHIWTRCGLFGELAQENKCHKGRMLTVGTHSCCCVFAHLLILSVIRETVLYFCMLDLYIFCSHKEICSEMNSIIWTSWTTNSICWILVFHCTPGSVDMFVHSKEINPCGEPFTTR